MEDPAMAYILAVRQAFTPQVKNKKAVRLISTNMHVRKNVTSRKDNFATSLVYITKGFIIKGPQVVLIFDGNMILAHPYGFGG